MLAPQDGGCTGTNRTTLAKKDNKSWDYKWLLLAQLAGPQWLNDLELAKVAAKGCEARLCKGNAALAAEGYQEYKYWYEIGGIGTSRT